MKLTKVISAKYIEKYKIEFEFNDGLKKIIDLQNQLWGKNIRTLKRSGIL